MNGTVAFVYEERLNTTSEAIPADPTFIILRAARAAPPVTKVSDILQDILLLDGVPGQKKTRPKIIV